MREITQLATGSDGQSHFHDIKLEYDIRYPEWGVSVSQGFDCNHFELWKTGITELLWVNAPERQYFVCLSGLVEIEVGSGAKRRFGQGDIIFATDVTGQGHITRILEPMVAMVIKEKG